MTTENTANIETAIKQLDIMIENEAQPIKASRLRGIREVLEKALEYARKNNTIAAIEKAEKATVLWMEIAEHITSEVVA